MTTRPPYKTGGRWGPDIGLDVGVQAMSSPPRQREADGTVLHAAVLIGTKPAGQAEGQLVSAHKLGRCCPSLCSR